MSASSAEPLLGNSDLHAITCVVAYNKVAAELMALASFILYKIIYIVMIVLTVNVTFWL